METTSQYLAHQLAFLDEELKAEELAKDTTNREELLESVEHLYRNTKPTMFTIHALLNRVRDKFPAETVRAIGDFFRGKGERVTADICVKPCSEEFPVAGATGLGR